MDRGFEVVLLMGIGLKGNSPTCRDKSSGSPWSIADDIVFRLRNGVRARKVSVVELMSSVVELNKEVVMDMLRSLRALWEPASS